MYWHEDKLRPVPFCTYKRENQKRQLYKYNIVTIPKKRRVDYRE